MLILQVKEPLIGELVCCIQFSYAEYDCWFEHEAGIQARLDDFEVTWTRMSTKFAR